MPRDNFRDNISLYVWAARHSNTDSTNGVTWGRGSLFVQPVADEQSEWVILFKTITHVTLFCEILHLKF